MGFFILMGFPAGAATGWKARCTPRIKAGQPLAMKRGDDSWRAVSEADSAPPVPIPLVTRRMIAIDTNVWIYAYDIRDPRKKRRAMDLIAQTRPLALPWQVGCEFLAASRKLENQGFDRQQAWAALDDMRTMADVVILPSPAVWDEARRIQDHLGLSTWDAILIAACREGRVDALISEDFGSLPNVAGIAIVHPFGTDVS